MNSHVEHDIKSADLATGGRYRIEWAEHEMPVLRAIRDRFAREKPLEGIRVSACLHVTTETANLVHTLQAGGADVVLMRIQPALDAGRCRRLAGVRTMKFRSTPSRAKTTTPITTTSLPRSITSRTSPWMTAPTWSARSHKNRRDLLDDDHRRHRRNDHRRDSPARDGQGRRARIPGHRRQRQQDQAPVRQPLRHGQSTLDGIIRATNILLAGRTVVVAGYGWCSRGIASRAQGMGANVIVTEIDPLRALEAVMDGFRVMPMVEAAPIGDIFITATGDINVLDEQHFSS